MAMKQSKKQKPWQRARTRRKRKVRGRIEGTAERPRLSVFRSNTAVYAQLIDDVAQKTIVSAAIGRKDLKSAKNTIEGAKELGAAIAKAATSKSISRAVFDRNGFLYHGKIKAVADGAREAGLTI